MSSHLLHLCRIVEGCAEWDFTCEHEPGAPQWRYRNQDGSFTGDPDECWFESWWDAVGSELLGDIEGPILAFPIAVKPSPDWDYDNGGTVVVEAIPFPPHDPDYPDVNPATGDERITTDGPVTDGPWDGPDDDEPTAA